MTTFNQAEAKAKAKKKQPFPQREVGQAECKDLSLSLVLDLKHLTAEELSII